MKIRRSHGMRAVAQRAKVSIATVSRVLNNSPMPSSETRRAVWRAAEALHYQFKPLVSQFFRQQRRNGVASAGANQTIGYLLFQWISEMGYPDREYYHRFLAGIQQKVRQHGHHLMLEAAPQGDTGLPAMIMEDRVDALIVQGILPDHLSSILRRMPAETLPVVLVDRHYPDLPVSSVMPDVEQAVGEMFAYLRSLGHRDIIVFRPASDTDPNEIHYQLFDKAFLHNTHGSLAHPGLCAPREITPATHQATMDGFAREVAAASPRPTAIVSWDVYAYSLLAEFRRLGIRVPEDISVIGMDDTVPAAVVDPPLTSYRFDCKEIGRSAVEILIQQMQDRSLPRRHLRIGGRIVERASCARRMP